jgi:hypothetical protein
MAKKMVMTDGEHYMRYNEIGVSFNDYLNDNMLNLLRRKCVR